MIKILIVEDDIYNITETSRLNAATSYNNLINDDLLKLNEQDEIIKGEKILRPDLHQSFLIQMDEAKNLLRLLLYDMYILKKQLQ